MFLILLLLYSYYNSSVSTSVLFSLSLSPEDLLQLYNFNSLLKQQCEFVNMGVCVCVCVCVCACSHLETQALRIISGPRSSHKSTHEHRWHNRLRQWTMPLLGSAKGSVWPCGGSKAIAQVIGEVWVELATKLGEKGGKNLKQTN